VQPNKIVHNYLTINLDVVWDVVKHDLPILMNELLKIIPEEEKKEN